MIDLSFTAVAMNSRDQYEIIDLRKISIIILFYFILLCKLRMRRLCVGGGGFTQLQTNA